MQSWPDFTCQTLLTHNFLAFLRWLATLKSSTVYFVKKCIFGVFLVNRQTAAVSVLPDKARNSKPSPDIGAYSWKE